MSRIPEPARLLTPRRTGVAAACLALTVLVAGCGGGDRVKPFQPSQIIAFGDETSAFDDTATAASASDRVVQFKNTSTPNAVVPYAARYTINVVPVSPAAYCKTALPVWNGTDNCPSPSQDVTPTDNPANLTPAVNAFLLPQSTTFSDVRIRGGLIPIVNEVIAAEFRRVDTGAVVPSPIPNPVYVATDVLYYCSMDFDGNNDYGNWVQRLARGLGGGALTLGGAVNGCPQDLGNGRSYAAWGAKVDDVAAQVNANRGALRDGVLVTMLAGQNDIMDAFRSVQATPSTSDAAHKLMREKGAQLGRIITSITGTGARVVYLTVPNMGGAPAAIANPGLATTLTKAFNEGYKGEGEKDESGGLVLSVINNGHKVVKVDGFNQIGALSLGYPAVAACEANPTLVKMPNGVAVGTVLDAAFPGQSALAEQSQSAAYKSAKAKALLLNCRSNNLRVVSGSYAASPPTPELRALYSDYLWADSERLAPLGHGALANIAVARIRDQL